MSIILVRHGETPLNVTRMLQPADTPLSDNGLAQAKLVARRLAGMALAGIVSSDLPRALSTAEAIAAASGLTPSTTALALLGPARTILDVPCGTGRFTQFLAAAGLEYTGGDASPAMLSEARRKHPDALFAVSDLSRLPYPDRSFDVALCIRLMHLVRDRELRASFLRELARVSRVGVIVDFRQDKALRVWLGRARAKLGLRAKPPGALALEKIHQELEAAGLEVIASIPVRRIPYLSDKIVLVARPRT